MSKHTKKESFWQKKCLPILNFIYKIIAFSLKQLMALLVSGPYVVYKLLFPQKRLPYKSHPFSKISRHILESRKAKRFIGVNLAITVLALTLIQAIFGTQPTLAQPDYFTQGQEEIAQIKSTYIITTEKTFKQPVAGYISQGFVAGHPGVDIAGNDNRLIYPIAPGKVVLTEFSDQGYGNTVVIDHGDNIFSRYAHLSYLNVYNGEEVNHETNIGAVGSTGWSTGYHLHLETYQDGIAVNPFNFIPQEYPYTYVDMSAK
ncbi:M23 family metallopeptidase [Candidatus Beckwithbacteria bacterium]|nr:M23 family metallopeptidase [Candidatus Beckwithbacteria bacterium]